MKKEPTLFYITIKINNKIIHTSGRNLKYTFHAALRKHGIRNYNGGAIVNIDKIVYD